MSARSNGDAGDQVAGALFFLISFAVTFMLLVLGTLGRWSYQLLARSFGTYWPHLTLVCWTVASVVSLALAVLIALLTQRLAAYLGVAMVVVLSGISLAVLDASLAHLSRQGPPDAEFPRRPHWPAT